jgi:hypothetical protein
MPDHEVIDDLLFAADPLRGTALPRPDSPEAIALMDRAKGVAGRSRRPTRRLVVGAGVVVVGALSAASATVAYSAGDGRAGSSDALVCVGSASHDLVMDFDPRTDDPVTTCAREWERAFGVAVPVALSACVDASEEGSIEVRPGFAETCAAHGDVPYTGPTGEQRRYAAFLEEVDVLEASAEAAGGPCTSDDVLRATLDTLLAKHGLTGWTYGFTGTDPEPDGDCARLEGIVEHEKMIVLAVVDDR